MRRAAGSFPLPETYVVFQRNCDPSEWYFSKGPPILSVAALLKGVSGHIGTP